MIMFTNVLRWDVGGSRLIRRDVTAGIQFSAMLRIYIAAYGKVGKL